MSKLELYYPTKPMRMNQSFGNPSPVYTGLGLAGHNGIDFWAPDSYPVYAAHDGEVTSTGADGSGGYGVVLRTLEPFDYGDSQAYFKTIYWHMKKENIKVRAGQKVKVGDLLGLADNTGLSTGSHLHFGLKPQAAGENDWSWYNLEQKNGYLGAIDPTPYFVGIAAVDYSTWTQIKAQVADVAVKTKILVELVKVALGIK